METSVAIVVHCLCPVRARFQSQLAEHHKCEPNRLSFAVALLCKIFFPSKAESD